MKLQASELPLGEPQTKRKTPRFAPLIALAVLLTIPLYYYPYIRDSTKKIYETYHAYESLEDSVRPTLYTISPNDNDRSPSNDHNDGGEPCVDQRADSQCQGGDEGGADTGVQQREVAGPDVESSQQSQTNVTEDSRVEGNIKETTTRESKRATAKSNLLNDEKCDLFTGEWVPNPEGPYYTNATCDTIQEHQNCLKFGRPDKGFLKWRWKPDSCELPAFEPTRFLELMRGKSIAFVGDSVARNHMQSLLCLLSRVATPVDLSDPWDQNRRYEYREHDFNVSMLWAPYLVRTEKTDPNDDKRPFKLYLDEFDPHWTYKIASHDYVIISAGHWFFRPTYFYVNNILIGCLYCPEPESNVKHLTSYFSYRRAFRTAFRAINEASGFNGVTFLRTFAPSHFEGGRWDKDGDCVRTRPFKRNETELEEYSLKTYLIQLDEFKIAQKASKGNGEKFKLFDVTKVMQLRPDGHPSKYGHWPKENSTWANDCVHWCLPGPIDSWNDFLQKILEREIGDSISTNISSR